MAKYSFLMNWPVLVLAPPEQRSVQLLSVVVVVLVSSVDPLVSTFTVMQPVDIKAMIPNSKICCFFILNSPFFV